MTREEFVDYRDNSLMERFVWCSTKAKLKYLQEKGYRYLFRCTHYKTGRFFWVFDKTPDILKDMDEYRDIQKKSNQEVSDPIAVE